MSGSRDPPISNGESEHEERADGNDNATNNNENTELAVPSCSKIVNMKSHTDKLVQIDEITSVYSTGVEISRRTNTENVVVSDANDDDSECPVSENTVTTTVVPVELKGIDKDFGYEKFETITLPYIYRNEKKFFAIRMIKKTYKKYFLIDPTKYGHIYSYSMTKSERNLLDRINFEFCNSFFGKRRFNREERLLEYEDVQDISEFVSICSRKLKNKSHITDVHFGIIKINNEHETPYVLRDGIKYVPLIYFQKLKEVENKLNEGLIHVEMFEGWDLSYLKFCAAVQGTINEDQFSSRAWHVINFADVVKTMPSRTAYEEYWPSDIVENYSIDTMEEDITQSLGQSGIYYIESALEIELAKSIKTMPVKERLEKMKEYHRLYKEKNKDLIWERQRKQPYVEYDEDDDSEHINAGVPIGSPMFQNVCPRKKRRPLTRQQREDNEADRIGKVFGRKLIES